ncbi:MULTISPECIES: hypothetical protein [unclassified Streptomyces]|uniref:hypothetical protein n=1 Tax=unclassified Streptomyces TaxID=2593676 RepID=UPI00093F2371|nr:hypothetical protein [Streptomyces sp. TSRI0281]OKI34984.1 hypothetical protein A6A29_16295 [Streptomyces sp. TSRI0281]
MRDDDVSPPIFTPCDAVRITPYANEGLPDRDQTTTYRFEDPIILVYQHRTWLPPLGTLGAVDRFLPPLVGFTTALDHDVTDTVNALAQALQKRPLRVYAVEMWSRSTSWRYLLIPVWRHLDCPDHNLIDPGPPGHATHTVGEALAAHESTPWPRLSPEEHPLDINPGVNMILTTTDTEPPPQMPTNLPGYPRTPTGTRP